MFTPVSSPASKTQPATDAPAAGKVISEIGVMLALHLAFALAVTVVLHTFGEF